MMAIMKRAAALRKLRLLEPIFRAEGARALYLFGSTARNEARLNSDVDILVEFSPRRKPSLFDIARLTQIASDVVQAPVDLVPQHRMRPHIFNHIQSTMKKVF